MSANSLIIMVVMIICGIDGFMTTIRNDVPRVDVNGNILDCHSGNIVKQGSTYFLYGEHYGANVGINETQWPQIRVYTSPDLVTWTDQGFALKDAPEGTYFTPFAVFNNKTEKFVLWFNAYLHGCCRGNWGVAQSNDGVHFEIVTLNETSVYPEVDCNGLFVDADGTGYVIYTSVAEDHQVAIERLTDDFLHSTRELVAGLFPDHYVEGAILFSRNGKYYVSYGSCCCFCRNGSGVVVYQADSLSGPWVRQGQYDLNCNSSKQICGGYGERAGDPLTVNAQGIGLSVLPTIEGTVYLWHGERWLSASFNNPTCSDECAPCKEPPQYIKGHGYMYWVPLEFDGQGNVMHFAPFVNEFQLDLLS